MSASNETFLNWCVENLNNCEWQECDESTHCFWNNELIGGWAGDGRYFFVAENTDVYIKANRMFNAFHNQPTNEQEMFLSVLQEQYEEPEEEDAA